MLHWIRTVCSLVKQWEVVGGGSFVVFCVFGWVLYCTRKQIAWVTSVPETSYPKLTNTECRRWQYLKPDMRYLSVCVCGCVFGKLGTKSSDVVCELMVVWGMWGIWGRSVWVNEEVSVSCEEVWMKDFGKKRVDLEEIRERWLAVFGTGVRACWRFRAWRPALAGREENPCNLAELKLGAVKMFSSEAIFQTVFCSEPPVLHFRCRSLHLGRFRTRICALSVFSLQTWLRKSG